MFHRLPTFCSVLSRNIVIRFLPLFVSFYPFENFLLSRMLLCTLEFPPSPQFVLLTVSASYQPCVLFPQRLLCTFLLSLPRPFPSRLVSHSCDHPRVSSLFLRNVQAMHLYTKSCSIGRLSAVKILDRWNHGLGNDRSAPQTCLHPLAGTYSFSQKPYDGSGRTFTDQRFL